MRKNSIIAVAVLIPCTLAFAILTKYSDGVLSADKDELAPIELARGESRKSTADQLAIESASNLPVTRSDAQPTGDAVFPQPTDIDQKVARNIERSEQRLLEQATEDIRDSYSLLVNSLDLTEQESDSLFSILIDDRIASTWTRYSDGIDIDIEDQSRRIAVAIGEQNLERFRALEHYIDSYSEVGKMVALFKREKMPISTRQSEELVELLQETSSQNSQSEAIEFEPDSIESIERSFSQQDEIQRLFMEKISSVLSPEQTVVLDGQYQDISRQRAAALERMRERLADGSALNSGSDSLWYRAPVWSK